MMKMKEEVPLATEKQACDNSADASKGNLRRRGSCLSVAEPHGDRRTPADA